MTNLTHPIIREYHGIYEVVFQYFEGYAEGVLYVHDGEKKDCQFSRFHEYFSLGKLPNNLHHIFLISRVMDLFFLRIIDTKNSKKENILIMKNASLSSFELRGKSYIFIIYRDKFDSEHLYTDFEDTPIFSLREELGDYIITNTLTGTIIHRIVGIYPCGLPIEERPFIGTVVKKEAIIMCDPLLSEDANFAIKKELLEKYITREASGVFCIEYDGSTNEISEIEKLLGFYSTANVILSDTSMFSRCLSFEEFTDFDIVFPEKMIPHERIDAMNPGWHTVRKSLLELVYMRENIDTHIKSLQGSIKDIDALESPYLKLQKDHSIMTLMDLEKTRDVFDKNLSLLKSLFTQSLS